MNKKNLNLIIMTVVYPGATNHAKQFVNSMNNQTNKKFSLIVVNDNNKNAAKIIHDKSNFEVRFFNSRSSRVNNRVKGLRFVIKKVLIPYLLPISLPKVSANFAEKLHANPSVLKNRKPHVNPSVTIILKSFSNRGTKILQ